MTPGIRWYIGMTGSGKTTRARYDVAREIEADGLPLLVVESERGVETFRDMEHVGTPAAVVDAVWGEGRHVAWTPESREDFDAVMRACREGRRVHVLVDEAAYWTSSHYLSNDLGRVMRAHRHAALDLRLTTQYFGDVHQAALQCNPELVVFACDAETTLERLEGLGFRRERVKTLGRGEFLTRAPREWSAPTSTPPPEL